MGVVETSTDQYQFLVGKSSLSQPDDAQSPAVIDASTELRMKAVAKLDSDTQSRVRLPRLTDEVVVFEMP